MSKYIDPEHMSPEDVIYVRQRPTLLREFDLQGLGDPTKEGFEGHDFNWSTYFDENGNLREEALDEDNEDPDEPSGYDVDGFPDGFSKPKPDNWSDMSDEEKREFVYGSATEEEDELPEEKRWNPDMTKAQLDAVIAARNADYDDDEQITIAKDDKQSRIDALQQDDAELAGDDDEEQNEE
jgi:hypothetical protein